MRILLTSDLHGVEQTFRSFSSALQGDYDLGVIAGDLLDDQLPESALARLSHHPDQQNAIKTALVAKEARVITVLKNAGKPVLVIPGNHDTTPLATDGTFINIHMSKFDLDSLAFVGYGCVSRTLGPDLQMLSLHSIENLVTERTILVTHIPPRGTLDLKRDGGQMVSFGSGILAEMVSRRRPKFHFFGDAHGSVGVKGSAVNAAYPLVLSFCGVDTDTGEIWTERVQ